MLPAYEIANAMGSLNIAMQLSGKRIAIKAAVVNPRKVLVWCEAERHYTAYTIAIFGDDYCECFKKNFPESNTPIYEGVISALYKPLSEHIDNEYKRAVH